MKSKTMTGKPLKPRLILREDAPRTTSLAVAEFFGKLHKDVLKAIRNLDCSLGFTERNFALVKETMTYRDSDGVTQTKETSRASHYEMTRDGFVFLAMGFTGPEAARFKEAYIDAFNAMEGMLASRETASIIQMVKEVVAEEVAKIRAEYAGLSAVQLAGRMGIPPWSTAGGYLSEAFTLMLFTLERRFTDAALLWTLYDEFECHREARQLSAGEIVEASGRALCRNTVYLARQRLIARGLLLNLPATHWRIQRDAFERMMRETQLVARVQQVPVVRPEVDGINDKLARWFEAQGSRTVQ